MEQLLINNSDYEAVETRLRIKSQVKVDAVHQKCRLNFCKKSMGRVLDDHIEDDLKNAKYLKMILKLMKRSLHSILIIGGVNSIRENVLRYLPVIVCALWLLIPLKDIACPNCMSYGRFMIFDAVYNMFTSLQFSTSFTLMIGLFSSHMNKKKCYVKLVLEFSAVFLVPVIARVITYVVGFIVFPLIGDLWRLRSLYFSSFTLLIYPVGLLISIFITFMQGKYKSLVSKSMVLWIFLVFVFILTYLFCQIFSRTFEMLYFKGKGYLRILITTSFYVTLRGLKSIARLIAAQIDEQNTKIRFLISEDEVFKEEKIEVETEDIDANQLQEFLLPKEKISNLEDVRTRTISIVTLYMMDLFYFVFHRFLFPSMGSIWIFLISQFISATLDTIGQVIIISFKFFRVRTIIFNCMKKACNQFSKLFFRSKFYFQLTPSDKESFHIYRDSILETNYLSTNAQFVSIVAFLVCFSIVYYVPYNQQFYSFSKTYSQEKLKLSNVYLMAAIAFSMEWIFISLRNIVFLKYGCLNMSMIGIHSLKDNHCYFALIFASIHIIQDIFVASNTLNFCHPYKSFDRCKFIPDIFE